MSKIRTILVAALFATPLAAAASPISIDFNTFAYNAPVTTVGNVTFSLVGGPTAPGAPTVTNSVYSTFVSHKLLTNTTDGGPYPTANQLVATFNGTANGVSFSFWNAGYSSSGRGNSTYSAYSSNGALLESGSLLSSAYALTDFSLSASNIHRLVFDNGTGGTSSWWFGLGSLSATNVKAVPEPSDLGMLGLGLGMIGFLAWRRRRQQG